MTEHSLLFKMGLLGYYIVMGSTSILVVKFSESGGGKLEYNVAVAVFLMEFLKMVAAIFFDNFGFCGSSPEQRRTTDWWSWCRYGGPAGLYCLQNNMAFFAISLLGPPLFSLLVNSKILFAALCGVMLLKQTFTNIQWLGLVNLVLALGVSQIRQLGDCGKKLLRVLTMEVGDDLMEPMSEGPLATTSYFSVENFGSSSDITELNNVAEAVWGESGIRKLQELSGGSADEAKKFAAFALGLVLVSVMAFTSGMSGAANEWLLKSIDSDVGFMRKNVWTYQWGCIFNIIGGLIINSSKSDGMVDPFAGFNFGVILIILVNTSLGLSVSMVLKYLDNVMKCIAGVFIIFNTTAVSAVCFGTPVCPEFILAVLVFGVASALYVGPHNAVLKKAAEDEAELQRRKLVDPEERSSLKELEEKV